MNKKFLSYKYKISILPESGAQSFIHLPALTSGILLKRYKRFLADIRLENGSIVTAHCPNSGSMRTCADPGMKVWISESSNPKRKLPFTWELIEMPTSMVGINAILPNRLAKTAITNGQIPEITGYHEITPEVTTNAGTRLDFCVRSSDGKTCYIEIKNCTFVENGFASFPDAVTSRGKKHVEELERLVNKGFRCILLFIIQRMDAEYFSPADQIDPQYGKALRKAVSNGVEILVYDTSIDVNAINLRNRLPVLL